MTKKGRLLLWSYRAPIVAAVARVLLTVYFLYANPLNMELPYFQLIPCGVLLVFTFMHTKLYSDSVPVITLIAPTLLHGVFVYVFKHQITIAPFVCLLVFDVIYLVLKSVKATYFPFDIEGDDDDFDDVENIMNTVG